MPDPQHRAKFRGRPSAQTPRLVRERLLHEASRLLEEKAEAFSMRELACVLGVDPMALYRHVENKAALLEEVVDFRLGCALGDEDVLSPGRTPHEKLAIVCRLYLFAIATSPVLVRMVATGQVSGGAVQLRFRRLFDAAVRDALLPAESAKALHDVLVDFLHGAALGGAVAADRNLETAISWLLAGASLRTPDL